MSTDEDGIEAHIRSEDTGGVRHGAFERGMSGFGPRRRYTRPTVEARSRFNIQRRAQVQKLAPGKESLMLPEQWVNRSTRSSARAALLAITALVGGSCKEPSRTVAPSKVATTNPPFTLGQGSTPTFIGQATFYHLDAVKRIADDWRVELNAEGGLEVVVRSFAYNPGAFTGWHKHPGPVLIQVVEGTVTFFEADDPCTPIEVSAGHGYVDAGNGHIGRNLTEAPARDVTIYLAPPGTQVPQLRIDMDEPPEAHACH